MTVLNFFILDGSHKKIKIDYLLSEVHSSDKKKTDPLLTQSQHMETLKNRFELLMHNNTNTKVDKQPENINVCSTNYSHELKKRSMSINSLRTSNIKDFLTNFDFQD